MMSRKISHKQISFSTALKQKLTQNQRRQLVNSNSQNIFDNEEQWDFSRHKFGQKQANLIKLISSQTRQIKIKEFRISSNNRPSILKQISPLKFIFTTMLDVGSNKITSVQGLTYIYMPFLERLNLYNNLITNIDAIRKCKLPNIIYLTLLSNPSVPEMSRLSQSYMPQMQWIWLQHKDKLTVCDQNVRWVFKVNCTCGKFSQLTIKSRNRIWEAQTVLKTINNKYPLLQIDRYINLQ